MSVSNHRDTVHLSLRASIQGKSQARLHAVLRAGRHCPCTPRPRRCKGPPYITKHPPTPSWPKGGPGAGGAF